MKLTRKAGADIKRFCIFVSQVKEKDGSILTTIDETGDEELRKELKKGFLAEVLDDCYRH